MDQTTSLIDELEQIRCKAAERSDADTKAKLGQYFTPQPVAQLMASMFTVRRKDIRILDAGAGTGALLAACVHSLCTRTSPPRSMHVTACEIDASLETYLETTLNVCMETAKKSGVEFSFEVNDGDFLEYAANSSHGLLGKDRFTMAIMNPPYFKIGTRSRERKLIRQIGVETTNIYTGFVAGAIRLLEDNGELVAITPRSFCNGPYYRPFRKFFLSEMTLRRIHVFESRRLAFREDEVLQENVIFHAKKTNKKQSVCLSSSIGPSCSKIGKRRVPYNRVVETGDPDQVIHLATDGDADAVAKKYSRFKCMLSDLRIEVSTGRVVDFRAREYLRERPGKNTVPLIYPTHMREGYVQWPSANGKKPNAIVAADETAKLLVPNEFFVLVKRFSAKEERRRISACVYDPHRFDCQAVGFENHLNFFHWNGGGLDEKIAKGLAVFLNSTLVDAYFRQFSGHTQVNATDLRNLRYPDRDVLKRLGSKVNEAFPNQVTIDELVSNL